MHKTQWLKEMLCLYGAANGNLLLHISLAPESMKSLLSLYIWTIYHSNFLLFSFYPGQHRTKWKPHSSLALIDGSALSLPSSQCPLSLRLVAIVTRGGEGNGMTWIRYRSDSIELETFKLLSEIPIAMLVWLYSFTSLQTRKYLLLGIQN